MNPILITVITLTAIGLLVAAILFLVAKKFKVEEDARIDDVEALLPGANCGGCGSAGCRDFACKLVAAEEFGELQCPVGGAETMSKIAALLGKTAVAQAPRVAVVKCNGTCENRPRTTNYEGYQSCKVKASLYQGDTACRFGCLGCGDCVRACKFDAIRMDPATGLPVVDESKCTGCGSCSKACPKGIIEIRPKGLRGLKVVVLCSNTDKGGVARKACQAACIGCSKCQKVCPHDAITVENNLAYIDASKCKLCTKCVDECPTGAIHKFNFPVKKAAPAAPVQATPAPKAEEKPAPVVKKPELVQPADEPKPQMRSAARFKVVPKPEPKAEEKPVEVPKPKVEERPVEVPKPKVEEKPVEVPKAEVEEKPVEVPKPKVEEKPVEVPKPKVEEKPVEVPKPKVEEKPVEVPKAEVEEKPVEVPKPESVTETSPAPVEKPAEVKKPAEAEKPAEPAPKPVAEPGKLDFPGGEPAPTEPAPKPKPKRTRTPKPKPAPKEDDREEVIDLDLFSGGVS